MCVCVCVCMCVCVYVCVCVSEWLIKPMNILTYLYSVRGVTVIVV